MEFNKYQELSSRTAKSDEKDRDLLANFALGLTGEAGEVADLIKKYRFHGHQLDRDDLIEDLSDRAIPFLLFNILIRGMNACVVHCDVLSRKAKGAFFIQNDTDDYLSFSSLNVLPYTSANAHLLDVTWEEKRYPEHIESKEMPLHLAYYTAYEAEKKRVKEVITELKKIWSQSIKKGDPV